MPIRTPRGRSAAYRTLWQWPLRSPARLFVSVAVALVVLAGVGFGFAALAGPDAGRTSPFSPSRSSVPGADHAGSSTASSAPEQTRLPPVAELTPSNLPPEQAPARVLEVATQWATAWTTHPPGTTAAGWIDRLRPFTTEEYLAVLGGVDPANVPATRVTGPAKAVRHSPRSVQVEVPTDALTLTILVIDGDTGWKVAGHDRAGQ